MKLTEEQKNQIVNGFVEILTHIADKEYQKREWIKGSNSNYDEPVCQFFDIVDPVLEDHENFNISDSPYQLLVKFRDAFRAFSDDNDFPHEFIESPEWKKIMEMAKGVLKAFNYQEEVMF